MNELESNLIEKRYKRRQRYLLPGLIVLVALPIVYWSRQRQADQLIQLQVQVLAMATTIVQGDDPTNLIKADNPTLRSGFIETLRIVLGDVDDPGHIQVEALEGDASPFADGRVTHTVWIRIDDQAAMGVRISWPQGGTFEIVGYWIPNHEDDELDPEG